MKKPYIVGIAGGSSSGKSTVQNQLQEKLKDLKVKSFHMDDYFKDREDRPVISDCLNEKQYVDDNHPQSLNLEQQHEDFMQALTEGWDIILVEGIFALWDNWLLPQYDLKLYIDCDPEERMARRIRRHLAAGEELDAIMERYVYAVKPRYLEYVEPSKWKADLILNGFLMSDTGVEVISGWIREKVEE